MIEYLKANESDKEEIIDFINYVFSHSRKPHDFKILLPKSYADDAINLGATHYLAKENGKIKALVAVRVIDVIINGNKLKYGLIGNVSVHPYSRGKGYMKTLMKNAIDGSRADGVDLLLLCGQRQRYGYFDFENAGIELFFKISKDNIRHCFGDVDCSDIVLKPMTKENTFEIDVAKELYEKNIVHSIRSKEEFVNIMHTFNNSCRIIHKGDEMIGYVYGCFSELILKDESYFPEVVKAIFVADNLNEARIKVRPFEESRVDLLGEICETSCIEQYEKINILCWENILKAFFDLQSKLILLEDGNVEVAIDDEVFDISVHNSIPTVKRLSAASENTLRFSHKNAERKFFAIESLWMPETRFNNWLPLPFIIDAPDVF